MLAVGIACAAIAYWHLEASRYRFIDLAVYRLGGAEFLHDRDIYAASFGTGLQVRLPFTYPPFAALVAVPLSLISQHLLDVLWTGMSLALLLILTAAATWLWPAQNRRRRALVLWSAGTIVVAATSPVLDHLSFGQVNFVVDAMCVVDCVLVLRVRRGAGLLIGLATAIKLVPGLFVLWLLLTRRWRAAAVAIGTFAAATGVAAALQPHVSKQYWTSVLWDTRRIGSPTYPTNQSLHGVILRALPAGDLRTVVMVIASLVVVAVLVRRLPATRDDIVSAVALVGAGEVLLSPIAWLHHLVWIAVWVVGGLACRNRRGLVIAAVSLALLGPPWPYWAGGIAYPAEALMLHLPSWEAAALQDTGAAVAIVVLLLWPVSARSREEREQSQVPAPAVAAAVQS